MRGRDIRSFQAVVCDVIYVSHSCLSANNILPPLCLWGDTGCVDHWSHLFTLGLLPAAPPCISLGGGRTWGGSGGRGLQGNPPTIAIDIPSALQLDSDRCVTSGAGTRSDTLARGFTPEVWILASHASKHRPGWTGVAVSTHRAL